MSKDPAGAKDRDEKGMDPLKGYVIVLGVLIAVLAFLYFRFSGQRSDYEAANARVEGVLTGKSARGASGRSMPIPDLAYEVEQFVATHKAAAKEGGKIGFGIPQEMMINQARGVNIEEEGTDKEITEEKKDLGYRTTTQGFRYKPTTINRLLGLAYNIEGRGMYRVSEIRWQLADPKENSQPPFTKINKPQIKVSVRTPIQKER